MDKIFVIFKGFFYGVENDKEWLRAGKSTVSDSQKPQ